MSIKSEITPPSEKSTTISFPKLMKTKLGTAALFTEERKAIVLKVIRDSDYSVGLPIGEGSDFPHLGMNAWTDFEGTLTLSNEP